MPRRVILSIGVLLAVFVIVTAIAYAQTQNSWAQVCSSAGVGYPGFLPYLLQGENFYSTTPGCSMRIAAGSGADSDGQGNTYYYTPAEFYSTPASLLKISFFYKPSVTFQDSTWRRFYYNIQFAGDGTPETTVSGQDDYDCHYVIQSQTCNANGWKKVAVDLGSSYAPNGFTSIRLAFPISDWQQFDWYVDEIYIINTATAPTPTSTPTQPPTPTSTPPSCGSHLVEDGYVITDTITYLELSSQDFGSAGDVVSIQFFGPRDNPCIETKVVASQLSGANINWSGGGGVKTLIYRDGGAWLYDGTWVDDFNNQTTDQCVTGMSIRSDNPFEVALSLEPCDTTTPTLTPTPTITTTTTPTITVTTTPPVTDICNVGDGLISRWTLDETIGTRSDSAGNYPLTSFGGVSQGQDSHGAYADFTGSSYDFLYNQAFDVPNGAFSVAGWVNFDSLPTSGTDGFLTEDGSFGLTVNSAGAVQFSIPGASSMSGAAGGGSWVHVAAILDPDNSQTALCLDGSCSSQATGLTAAPQSGAALIFGSAGDYGAVTNNFSGFMDEWRVYNRALPQSDVTALYQCDAALATPTPGATGQPTIPPPTATPTPGGGDGPGDGWTWLEFLAYLLSELLGFLAFLIGALLDFLMFIIGPLLDLIYFLIWLILKIVQLIGLLLWALWWAFRFTLGLITGMVSDIDTATPVTPLELGDYGTGYNFIRNLLASTPFAVIIYLINALLWFTFIRWAIAQFSDLQ